jgi:hypothetical protein
MSRPRRTPYTVIGIRRVPCCFRRCRRRGHAQWQVCADGRAFRVVCYIHDILLNRMALELVGDPDIERKMARYTAKVLHQVRERGTGPA